MSKKIVGTCGLCGGPVTTPLAFHSTTPPRPTCDSCGAHPQDSFGPTLPMEKPKKRKTQLGMLTVTLG